MAKNDYPLDKNGTSQTNKITEEVIEIYPSSDRQFNILIPQYAPFFSTGFQIHLKEGSSLVAMQQGVDWNFAFHYQGASLATGKPIYGGILFLDPEFTGTVQMQYQTLGGEYTLDDIEFIDAEQRISKDPRAHTWEEVAAVQSLFPPQTMPWQYSDMVSAEQVRQALSRIANAIINKSGASVEDHLTDYENPHLVTKNQLDLGNVENFAPSSIIEAIDGFSNDTLITPLALKSVLDNLGLLNLADVLAQFNNHISNRNNPHEDVKHHVDLSQVENLPLATPNDIIARRSVRKYVTLDQLIEYLALHNNGPRVDESEYPPKDALLTAYCNNLNKMGVYADGKGGSYEKIIELNSRDCGYVAPDNRQYPARGTLMSKYCVNKDQFAVFADGYGGTYQQIIKVNSAECGYQEETEECPEAGTVISTSCSGTNLIKTVADGNCGTTVEIESDSPTCGGGQPTYPPADLLLDTFCSGVNLMGKYSDGKGGDYSAVLKLNSEDCGWKPPPPPPPPPPPAVATITMTSDRTSLTVGQVSKWTVKVNNYILNQANRYYIQYYKSDAGTNNFREAKDEVMFPATKDDVLTFNLYNAGNWPAGVHKFKAAIKDKTANTVQESSVTSVNVIATKKLDLKINGKGNATVVIGTRMTIEFLAYDLPINTNISWYLKIRGADSRDAGKGTLSTKTNANGYFKASSTSLLTVAASIRGNVTYSIVATWKEGFGYEQSDINANKYAIGDKTLESNVITIKYTDPPPPPPPAVASAYKVQYQPLTAVTTSATITGGTSRNVKGYFKPPNSTFKWLKFFSIRRNGTTAVLLWANGPNSPLTNKNSIPQGSELYQSSYYDTVFKVVRGDHGMSEWQPKFIGHTSAAGIPSPGNAGRDMCWRRSGQLVSLNQDGTYEINVSYSTYWCGPNFA